MVVLHRNPTANDVFIKWLQPAHPNIIIFFSLFFQLILPPFRWKNEIRADWPTIVIRPGGS
jgi:hypothetical protein